MPTKAENNLIFEIGDIFENLKLDILMASSLVFCQAETWPTSRYSWICHTQSHNTTREIMPQQ